MPSFAMLTNTEKQIGPGFRWSMLLVWLVSCLLIVGCSSTRNPYSEVDAGRAEISGFENVRVFLDSDLDTPAAKRFGGNRFANNRRRGELKYLAISGGGAGGAFTVGALKAWTQQGNRPTFDLVSGVSTGALIAPFAFLGPRYDKMLEHIYTSGVATELVDRKFIVQGVLGESLLYQQPLRRMVETYLDRAALNEIAAEYRKGRNLFVLTTNLDTQRAVLWDMGAIANSPRPDALSLFHNILLASASIPGIFPAVQINATIDGRDISEMHSDGGSSTQIVTVPEAVLSNVELPQPSAVRGSDIYLLINNTLMPEFSITKNSTYSVTTRAYATLIKSQTRQSLFAIYEYCQRAGVDFHMASIEAAVPYTMSDPFNNAYMRTVFSIGYDRMKAGNLWRNRPVFTPPATSPRTGLNALMDPSAHSDSRAIPSSTVALERDSACVAATGTRRRRPGALYSRCDGVRISRFPGVKKASQSRFLRRSQVEAAPNPYAAEKNHIPLISLQPERPVKRQENLPQPTSSETASKKGSIPRDRA